MQSTLRKRVRERAGNRCEYYRIRQRDDPFFKLQIDHIIAEQHGGPTLFSYLALCCLRCNLHKGLNIAGRDPSTKALVPLYHPRRHKWEFHFRIEGPFIFGLTSIGRATVRVLSLNHSDAVTLRESLINDHGGWQ